MTTEKLSDFNERFYKIHTNFRNEVCDTIGKFMRKKDEKILSENLTFSLGSDYFYEMADLCFEIINTLKAERKENNSSDDDDDDE